jgi:hypothetical protein
VICPSCGGELSPSHKFCPSCGTPSGPISQAPTASAPAGALPGAATTPAGAGVAPVAAPIGRLISSDSLPVGGFTPGMVLSGRYRIIGLIGRGGMGEVYRADDLKLGQPVALKFLPKALADDSVRRERLFAEVRIARQVSHPNICRVYDISELEGRHFLTMEYIDGEDLASLLKRIGSLHGAKALDVARQLCAGLAAAHDKGVLHRDLKPANVMIDGRGRVRVTDFGLAVAVGEEIPEGDVSGTPPYMAPEQFAGKGASVRSDIYALGLVFYEVFTGRRAFEAKTLAELRAKKETSSPTAPSEFVRDIDPIVERVILRCIDKDPRQRPASAAHVAAALPGGDPLAAAIAAGETPSPEMVAASGSTEGLRPWIAWACLVFVIVGICAAVLLGRNTRLIQRLPMENHPEAMVAKAREILKNIGHFDPPADTAFGFETNEPYFRYVAKVDQSPTRYEKLPALAMQFWYRQSPRPIEAASITKTDPPLIAGGESSVWLDSRGNLTGLQVVPLEEDRMSGAVQPAEWSALFKAAGLDQAKWVSAEPQLTPPIYADARAAWTGTLPDLPETPIRIEAAALHGKAVSWRMITPWSAPLLALSGAAPAFIVYGFLFTIVIGSGFFARRNLRMGRGDRRGAARLAWFMFGSLMIAWILATHHTATLEGFFRFLLAAGGYLLWAGIAWLVYIALEPFFRRRWPGMLVGWNRLLAGSYLDPLVGRDLLVGCVFAVVLTLLGNLGYFLALLLGAPQPLNLTWTSGADVLVLFRGARMIVPLVLAATAGQITTGLILAFVLFLLRILLRRTWAAGMAFFLIIATILVIATTGGSQVLLVYSLLQFGLVVFVFYRFGLLVVVVLSLFSELFWRFPITTQMSVWYSGIGLTGLALLLAFSIYAFDTSLGGQPLFGRASLED